MELFPGDIRHQILMMCRTGGSLTGDYEEFNILGYKVM
jgi:hypothetical protein